jgi:uncharacterized protein
MKLRSIFTFVALLCGFFLYATQTSAAAEGDFHREFGYVSVKDGPRMAYVVWRPKTKGRFPTVFVYSPYGTSGDGFDYAKSFLQAGYAYVGADMRGTGCSTGVDEEAGAGRPHTVGRDGAEVVEWIARQPWSTGSVGMVGTSYAGELQLAVAANRPPHLKAIVPGGIAASNYHESYMPGGMEHLGTMAVWTLDIQMTAARKAESARIDAGDEECARTVARRSPQNAWWLLREHPLYDEWWEERTDLFTAQQVHVPTLILMGWQDEWNLNAGTHLFKHLQSARKKLVVFNGGHRVASPWKRGYRMSHEETIRWLDRWVKNVDNGVEREPPVTVYWEVRDAPPDDGSRATPGWKTTYAAWPAPNLRWTTFYLTVDGKLSAERPATSAGDGVRKYLYPIGTELPGSNEQFAVAPHPLGSLSYRTEPMPEDTTILGFPRLKFAFSSEQKDTDFMFTLKDVDPQGNTLFLQRAYLRASLRAVDREMSTPDAVVQSFRKIEELQPGERYEVELSIPALGHVVRQGHRLELSILAPSAVPGPVMGGVPLALPSVNQVFHLPAFPSTLILPVVPGERAQRAAPECGSLQFQPCRKASAR